jgi:hypothetical protein
MNNEHIMPLDSSLHTNRQKLISIVFHHQFEVRGWNWQTLKRSNFGHHIIEIKTLKKKFI